MRELSVDVFSDVVCPWCFVGGGRLEKVLASLDGKVKATVRYHPFLLDPSTPPEGYDIPTMLKQKYGRDPKQMQGFVEEAARESGLELDLSKQTRMVQTQNAHTLLRHAAEKGTQAALAKALFRANFVEAKDVSSPAVLTELAAPFGFTADEVQRLLGDASERAATQKEAEMAARSGIRGVPFFVFNERLAMSGCQPEQVFSEAIAEALEMTAGSGA